MSGSWKVSLPCNRAEGEALGGDVPALAALDEPPIVIATEPDEDRPDDWRIHAYMPDEPSDSIIDLLLSLAPSASRAEVSIEQLGDDDWVTLSQAGLEPVNAGRFHVFTSAHPGDPAPGQICLRIEAGQAFGTGHHATTSGCLAALDGLAMAGRSFVNTLDLGTGTGLLALAIAKTWPAALVIASDIDPISIEVTAENIAVNDAVIGTAPGEITLTVADGMADPSLAARAPYDLIAANILAGPLIAMAADITAALAPGGSLLLAGLLSSQADAVTAAYAAAHCHLVTRHGTTEWPTLVLERG